MRGIALRENRITFTPIPDLSSKAYRFDWLLEEQQFAFRCMLSDAGNCVTPEVLEELARQYPEVSTVKVLRGLSYKKKSARLLQIGATVEWRASIYHTKTRQDMLRLASDNPKFRRSTAKGYAPDKGPVVPLQSSPAIYSEGSQWALIGWKPLCWEMPADSDLDAPTGFLPRASDYSDWSVRKDRYNALWF